MSRLHRRAPELACAVLVLGAVATVVATHRDYGVTWDEGVQARYGELVVDYFRWRQQDAGRNALNGHCYWRLRAEGKSPAQAQRTLDKTSLARKHDLLFERGVNFDKLPAWQKRGVGLRWETYRKRGANPLTGATTTAERQRLRVDDPLPLGDEYTAYLRELVSA